MADDNGLDYVPWMSKLTGRVVERWALGVVESTMRGQRSEDARVEFKRELPAEVQKVARRIAGHANASRGEDILWVVGVDEGQRSLVPGRLPQDGADFWSQIWSKFDGPHPELVDVHVEFDGTELLALGFACDRVPYVIKTGGESPRFEVPWREGTRVDTATRSQLLRMMVPLRDAPTVEVRQHVATSDTVLTITFLVIPANSEPVALPIHHAVLECGGEEIKAEDVHGNNSALSQPHPVLREAKGQGVYFYGPAEIVVRWRLPQHRPPQQCRVRLGFEPGAISVVVTDGVPSR